MSTKLNILGAKRVDALLKVLNRQEQDEISEYNKNNPSESDIEREVYKELGLDKHLDELERLIDEANAVCKKISDVTGQRMSIKLDKGYSLGREYERILDKKRQELDNDIKKIKMKYEEKRTRLWLCSTLEEAKAIVGIGD